MKPVWPAKPILSTSKLMMETYQATPAELASEICVAVGTQTYTKSNQDILTRKS